MESDFVAIVPVEPVAVLLFGTVAEPALELDIVESLIELVEPEAAAGFGAVLPVVVPVAVGSPAEPVGAGVGLAVCAQATPAVIKTAAEASKSERTGLSLVELQNDSAPDCFGALVSLPNVGPVPPATRFFLLTPELNPRHALQRFSLLFRATVVAKTAVMKLLLLPLLALAALPRTACAEISCTAAGTAAELAAALPANMLISIGTVESGRADLATGRVTPWPWTVNADGAGHYFASKQDAIAFKRRSDCMPKSPRSRVKGDRPEIRVPWSPDWGQGVVASLPRASARPCPRPAATAARWAI